MTKMALAVMLFAASNGLCQAPASESDTLHSLLVEVHQLRQDIEAMTAATQRVQIALYTLQMQDAAVGRAAQRADDARNRCRAEEKDRQHTASEVQNLERVMAHDQELISAPPVPGSSPADDAKALEARIADVKRILDMQTAEVQTCQGMEAEASSGLRNEQAKLAGLQERIERLDKALEQLGGAAK